MNIRALDFWGYPPCPDLTNLPALLTRCLRHAEGGPSVRVKPSQASRLQARDRARCSECSSDEAMHPHCHRSHKTSYLDEPQRGRSASQ